MKITMNISHINTIDEITGFLKSTASFKVSDFNSKDEVYKWINNILTKLPYRKLKKKEKRKTKEFIIKITGYNPGHVKRLIAKHKIGQLYWKPWQKTFAGIYTDSDIYLLHLTDEIHKLSGQATKKILQREYEVYDKNEYRKIRNISVPHIYNIRKSISYMRMGKIFKETKSRNIPIGIRKRPSPNGEPGYLRVDSVHQGDMGKIKGLYWINMVDEITQFEFVFCTPHISEMYIKTVLNELIAVCPFKIINFHSDNGSEYINYVVEDILNRLHIKQTKSRSRRSNDNGLAETKNGSVIRKHFGYIHIPATDKNAHILNTFCINYFNIYLNYHRPCGYSTTVIDKRGKEKKIYPTKDYETPYDKFKLIPNVQKYLKNNLSIETLDKIAYSVSDNDFGIIMNEKKKKAFFMLNMQNIKEGKQLKKSI